MELNFNLHAAQMDIFRHPAKYKVVAAGRRFGKSYLSAITLLVEGLKDINEAGYDLFDKDVWYIAPTFQQAKDILWGLLKHLGRDVIASTVENTATIRLINGRQIKLKGSDRPDTLVGVGLGYVVLDEYSLMKADVWERNVFPTLTDVEGGALFIGTPRGKNHFYELYLQGESQEDAYKDWMSWHFNSTDNPTLNQDIIRAAEGMMSKQMFRQEFEANFNATGGNVFNEKMVIYGPEPADGDYYIAVDPAGFEDKEGIVSGNSKRLDETAIAVVKVGEYGWWVKEIIHGRWTIRETAVQILRAAQKVRARAVGIEQGIAKQAIMPTLEDLKRRLGVFPHVEELKHGNQKKTDRIVWALQGRFEQGRIIFNEKKGSWVGKFIEQMLDFPNKLAHDDLLDALAYINQLGNVSYGLGSLELDEWEPLDLISGY